MILPNRYFFDFATKSLSKFK